MSYILDALRRSQAERERGQVPGLDAQPAMPDLLPPTQREGWRWWAGGVAGSVVLAAGVVWLMRSPVAVTPAPATAVNVLPTPSATATSPANVPAPSPAPAPAPLPSPSLPVVVSAPPAATPAAVPPSSMPPPAGPAAPAVAATVAPAPAAVASSADAPARAQPRQLRLSELSADQRRELPPLSMGGLIWSENRASRFVLINGQVVREGEAAAPGVTLESLTPRSALLRWRDLRIEVPM